MKKLSNLKGAKALSKKEQRTINGGRVPQCCLNWDPLASHCYRWDYDCLNGR